jgi:hypothetical protein
MTKKSVPKKKESDGRGMGDGTSRLGVSEDGCGVHEGALYCCSCTDGSSRGADCTADGEVAAFHEPSYGVVAIEYDDEFGEVCPDLQGRHEYTEGVGGLIPRAPEDRSRHRPWRDKRERTKNHREDER